MPTRGAARAGSFLRGVQRSSVARTATTPARAVAKRVRSYAHRADRRMDEARFAGHGPGRPLMKEIGRIGAVVMATFPAVGALVGAVSPHGSALAGALHGLVSGGVLLGGITGAGLLVSLALHATERSFTKFWD
ncbi:MAG TPA: hypothetical protein VMZ28_14180, partial [Kofleriaceae bacterium]|nr:hypothetical protein [Kofleriaceae bacterium]